MNAAKIYNALIKTHHITSRKKIARLKKAARRHVRFALIRSGGSPGIMYAEGPEEGLKKWIEGVAVRDLYSLSFCPCTLANTYSDQALRYKDYQLIRRPSQLEPNLLIVNNDAQETGFQEVETVAGFASKMKNRGVLEWWRQAMGFMDGEGD